MNTAPSPLAANGGDPDFFGRIEPKLVSIDRRTPALDIGSHVLSQSLGLPVESSAEASQAEANPSPNERPALHIVEEGETSTLDQLGDYLGKSGLSTLDQMALLESMLRLKERQAAYEESRRRLSTHSANVQQSIGSIIKLPVVKKKDEKYGPKRASNQ